MCPQGYMYPRLGTPDLDALFGMGEVGKEGAERNRRKN